jgi:hypothetical protein
MTFDAATYRADMAVKGYRVDDQHETGTDGWATLAGQISMQDQYLHNVAISLRHAIELAGGRGTPAGKAVGDLFHTISAQALSTYDWLKHVDEVGLPATEARVAAAYVPGKVFTPGSRTSTPRRPRVSRILEAIDLVACDACPARHGDPCRTRGGRTIAPHASRIKTGTSS